MRRVRTLAVVLAALVGFGLTTACGQEYASSTSDTHVCVFDGSERGGQRLKDQVPPGAEAVKIDDNDQVVRIPASNRFFMASTNDNTRDPLAPSFYTGFAAGNVEVHVEGQVRFQFNLPKACEWFSEHGRRNSNEGDLGFNARGADAANAGWFRFLAENFGVTMQEVTTEVVGAYDWAAMTFNYPINSDEAGTVPEGQTAGEATQLALGDQLGQAFTDRLNANLGGEYFCGTDVVEDDPCPPMRFQVVAVNPTNAELRTERERLENLQEQLRAAELEGDLQAQQLDATLGAEASHQALLEAQLHTAELQAQVDTANCRVLASFGLDCEGHHPTVVFNGAQPQ